MVPYKVDGLMGFQELEFGGIELYCGTYFHLDA